MGERFISECVCVRHAHTRTHTHMHTCTCTRTHTCMRTHGQTHTQANTCTHAHMGMHTHVCAHAHTHAHTRSVPPCYARFLRHARLFVTPRTVAHQALHPWGFSRQVEYWSGLPCPLPGNFPNPGLNPGSPALQADSLSSESPRKVHIYQNTSKCG